mgnify:FL=1
MAGCSKTLFLLRLFFLGYFALEAYLHLNNIPERAKSLSLSYSKVGNGVKHLTSHPLPEVISAAQFSKHSLNIATGLAYGQLILCGISLLTPCFMPLLGFIHLLVSFIELNIFKYFIQSLPITSYEPLLISLALFAGCFVFGCGSGDCSSSSKKKNKNKNKGNQTNEAPEQPKKTPAQEKAEKEKQKSDKKKK